jgi:co-chaperonin GroES (HSP10)
MAKISFLMGNRLSVSIFKPEESSKGGIIVPTTSQERKCSGTVVSVGRAVVEDVVVGDVITFLPFGVVELPTVDGICTIVDMEDVVQVSGNR